MQQSSYESAKVNSSADKLDFIAYYFIKQNANNRRGQYDGCKIGVANLILSVSKTSGDITAVQLKKHYLMEFC